MYVCFILPYLRRVDHHVYNYSSQCLLMYTIYQAHLLFCILIFQIYAACYTNIAQSFQSVTEKDKYTGSINQNKNILMYDVIKVLSTMIVYTYKPIIWQVD